MNLNNGMSIPQLGFGTWKLTGDTARDSVTAAIKTGYRMIDTAQGYGNEAEVWAGIVASGIDREDLIISTKVSVGAMRGGADVVRESIRGSLAALGGSYIDILLIHWPVKGRLEETWKVMEEFVAEGSVRALGLCNCNPHHIDEILAVATVKPVFNQIELHPYLAQGEVSAESRKRGLEIESWGPLGQGRNGVREDPVIVAIAAAHGKSVAQVIIRWHIQRGNIVIPGSSKPEHIAENFDVFDFALSPDEMRAIDALDRNERINPKNDPETYAS
jgi:2,5-diketo-D-gluconate reductase A